MRTRLEFGIYNPEEQAVEYSSEHWLERFVFKQIPPVGTRLRFDRPLRDNDGRYGYVSGSFDVDGGEPIYAVIKDLQMNVDLISQDHSLSIQLEVERDDDSAENTTSISEYITDLIQFRDYLRALKKAKKVKVSEAGFPQELAYLLQLRGCQYLSEVAGLTVSSLEKEPAETIQHVEETLQKYSLKLSRGPALVLYSGS